MSHYTETTTQIAKKPHRCSWCLQIINSKDIYKRYRWFDRGDAVTVKMHPECYDAMQEEASEWGYDLEWTPGQERPKKAEQ